ncbi:alpha/beta fold hydrolase [Hydrogenophaga sp. BPS33]|uniref:alpha/beta fold hydrolase n=1 Tax=Hydrogenophaga sp. BPS33 TaxID=2651974 RepID=UPI00131FBC91|nr:alpha/beta fold hydrolase [Hydrogenophaga sp. BPS33]QHE87809.1 alpha/beta fold hydrolase [Hydrogenophaga sp. BPS33]
MTQIPHTPDASRAEAFCDTSSGRVHYIAQGDGPPLLLLHSNGCSWHEFEAVLDGLAQRHRCIAWDMPGHGDSDPPQGHQSIADYARAALAFMDALGIARAHVCGVSVGGFIAIEMALAAPSRVASAVIVETAVRTSSEWAGQWLRIETSFALATQTHEEVAPRFRSLSAALLNRWNIDRNKAGGWRMVDVMWAIRQYGVLDRLRQLSASDVPAAVLMGDQGPVIAGRARYEECLPGAAIHVIGNAGHFPMLDDPPAFVHAVTEATTAQAPLQEKETP